VDFINRNIQSRKGTDNDAYYQFMKYGIERYYWLEYVTLAYVNSPFY